MKPRDAKTWAVTATAATAHIFQWRALTFKLIKQHDTEADSGRDQTQEIRDKELQVQLDVKSASTYKENKTILISKSFQVAMSVDSWRGDAFKEL